MRLSAQRTTTKNILTVALEKGYNRLIGEG